MFIKRRYGFFTTLKWSKWPLIYGALYALLITTFHAITKIDIALPYAPISVLGIATAFYLGFKNNSSYDRLWEARKIYGAIVNNSRSFGVAVVSFCRVKMPAPIKENSSTGILPGLLPLNIS